MCVHYPAKKPHLFFHRAKVSFLITIILGALYFSRHRKRVLGESICLIVGLLNNLGPFFMLGVRVYCLENIIVFV